MSSTKSQKEWYRVRPSDNDDYVVIQDKNGTRAYKKIVPKDHFAKHIAHFHAVVQAMSKDTPAAKMRAEQAKQTALEFDPNFFTEWPMPRYYFERIKDQEERGRAPWE